MSNQGNQPSAIQLQEQAARQGTCAKCNASLSDYQQRQIANLHSLLRSVTGNLEAAAELLALDTKITIDEMRAAAREVDTVLEVLS